MKKIIMKSVVFVLMLLMAFSSVNIFAENNIKLQLYFEPKIMDDNTGELVVDVKLRNVGVAIPSYMGDISTLTFGFEYDSEEFDILKDDKSNVIFRVDDTTLIKSKEYISFKVDGNKATFNFLDTTLSKNLIDTDGTVCSFTLVSKRPLAFWHSVNKYPIRFIPASVGVVAYHLPSYSVNSFTNYEALDSVVGPYNLQPTLTPKKVDKHITFTAGNGDVNCGGVIVKTDAMAFLEGDSFMLPFRYFADAVGMKVTWDTIESMAGAYCDYKTVKVSLKNKSVYINSAKCNPKALPVEIDGRIYISSDVIPEIFPGAVVNVNKDAGTAEIYIP